MKERNINFYNLFPRPLLCLVLTWARKMTTCHYLPLISSPLFFMLKVYSLKIGPPTLFVSGSFLHTRKSQKLKRKLMMAIWENFKLTRMWEIFLILARVKMMPGRPHSATRSKDGSSSFSSSSFFFPLVKHMSTALSRNKRKGKEGFFFFSVSAPRQRRFFSCLHARLRVARAIYFGCEWLHLGLVECKISWQSWTTLKIFLGWVDDVCFF